MIFLDRPKPWPDPSIAAPHHVDADENPAFHIYRSESYPDADPDPTFQFDRDLDLATHFFPDLNPPMLRNYPLKILLITLIRIRI
jgi:hypothetical protein